MWPGWGGHALFAGLVGNCGCAWVVGHALPAWLATVRCAVPTAAAQGPARCVVCVLGFCGLSCSCAAWSIPEALRRPTVCWSQDFLPFLSLWQGQRILSWATGCLELPESPAGWICCPSSGQKQSSTPFQGWVQHGPKKRLPGVGRCLSLGIHQSGHASCLRHIPCLCCCS